MARHEYVDSYANGVVRWRALPHKDTLAPRMYHGIERGGEEPHKKTGEYTCEIAYGITSRTTEQADPDHPKCTGRL